MYLDELVGWYQKNISKYDKHKWDETVNQNNGTINGKQKAAFIDVDLVRGSAFSKAKPKQTLFCVVGLAILRFLFLPIYSKWWICQTSSKIYKFLLTLYVLQILNWGIYIYITRAFEEHIVSVRDLIVPNLLSFLLTLIQSQIVATGDVNFKLKFSLPEKERKGNQRKMRRCSRVKSKGVADNNKISKTAPVKSFVEQNERAEHTTDGAFNIHRNNFSNCPNGLRKRNTNWKHVYSPFWINRNQVETQESERKSTSDDAPVGSEPNTDYGFESLKSSSSEDQLAKPLTNAMPHQQDLDSDGEENLSSHIKLQSKKMYASPWLGVTSNSECSYSSGSESDSMLDESGDSIHPSTSKTGGVSDKISCTLWHQNEIKKVEMSLQDISSVITNKVESMTGSCDYIYIGILLSVLLACVPVVFRLCEVVLSPNSNEFNIQNIPTILLEKASLSRVTLIKIAFGETIWEFVLFIVSLILRFSLSFLWFFMLAVAERTFKQRLLYAKLFSHLTSSRRAKKSEVPHFRLSKLRNIKLWLSIRSYLKKRGPQRSVDVIVSATLILSIVFVSFLCAESLNDSVQQHWQYDLEVFVWSCCLGCFILRFMTLGTAINTKYRSVSILITEQINLYLKMEQNPEKKQKLTSANNVLKLAADLLKEIESPFKISGFNINPYLSAAIRVLVVSAISGVCSEMLGFKIKLFKLKEPKNI